eukprot:9190568-Pyramimonas_sp.AAC.1
MHPAMRTQRVKHSEASAGHARRQRHGPDRWRDETRVRASLAWLSGFWTTRSSVWKGSLRSPGFGNY